MRPCAASLFFCLAAAVAAPAVAQVPPDAGASATAAASPALVNHLLAQIEQREQPPQRTPFGTAIPASPFLDAEQQLRKLGPRASAAAPRVAELLARTDRYASELSWTLWSISAEATEDDLPALSAALARGSASDRLLALGRVGRIKSVRAVAALQGISTAADVPSRLLVAVALGFQRDVPGSSVIVPVLAAMLKDGDRSVRQAALNGLRLQGPRAVEATPALIDHLRGRDNVFMTAQVLAHMPTRDLQPLKPELEALLAEPKLTEYQKRPVVDLLLRLESATAAAAPLMPAAGGFVPAPSPPRSAAVAPVMKPAVPGSLAATRELACIDMAQAQNVFTPPDLHTAVAKCVAESRFTGAAQLFLLAGLYSSFDAERVADRSARGGGQVLNARTVAMFSMAQREKLSVATVALLQDAGALRNLCNGVQRLGPPDYFPKYLVLHGANAATSSAPLDNALAPGFDADAAWVRMQQTYLRCPKLEGSVS